MSQSFEALRVSRRQALRTIAGAGALLAGGMWPGMLRAEGVGAGQFQFAVLNDLHYFDERCGPFFERVARQIKATPGGVDLVLLAGDLSDWGQDFQFAAVRDIFRTTGAAVHAVCGNHDWTTWDDRDAYLDVFPKATNYTFDHKGYQVIGLDSTDRNLMRVNVTADTLQWLDDTLARIDKKRPLVVFSHFPLHPQLQWPARNAAEVLARFKEHNLQAVYGGHCHAFREQPFGSAVVQTNRCCSFKVRNHDRTTQEKGYFLCQAKDGKLTQQFVPCAV